MRDIQPKEQCAPQWSTVVGVCCSMSRSGNHTKVDESWIYKRICEDFRRKPKALSNETGSRSLGTNQDCPTCVEVSQITSKPAKDTKDRFKWMIFIFECSFSILEKDLSANREEKIKWATKLVIYPVRILCPIRCLEMLIKCPNMLLSRQHTSLGIC